MLQLDLYIKQQDELVKKYNGKIIALHNGEFQGVFETRVDALRSMQKNNFIPGSFIIIRCSPGDKEYTSTIHTPFF